MNSPVTPSPASGVFRSRFLWFALAMMLVLAWPSGGTSLPEVPYSTAYSWIEDGKVSEVVLEGSRLEGVLREPQPLADATVERFATRRPADDEKLVELLREKRTIIEVNSDEPPLALQILSWIAPWLLIILLWWWLSRRARNMMAAGGGPLGGFLRRGKKFEQAATPSEDFDKVAGLANAKRDLGEIVAFLRDPERARRLGARVPRGVLLVGPPGTGKTLLARAVAGEAGVPFFSIAASELVELFVGVGAARVRELFQEAKRQAPAIVFIDEIDAVGRARGAGFGGGHDEREQTLNQLLAEMDGFERDTRVVVLAATNRPDVLDPALVRPGRFDRRVVVDVPGLDARRAILAVHTKDKPLAEDVDLDRIAQQTIGFSGADLANLANEAALHAGRRDAEVIDRTDFAAAYDKIVLGDPREAKLTRAERTRVAVHEAGHALVAWLTPGAAPIRRVSILPRGMALGATHQVQLEDRHLMTRSELAARLHVLLGGRAAEQLVLGEASTGAEHDLKEATRLASRMVAHYGMSDELGPVYFEHGEEHAFLGQRLATDGGTSDATVHAIEQQVRRLLGDAAAASQALLEQHRGALERLVAALLERETLEQDELLAVLGAPTASAGSELRARPAPAS